MTVARPCGLPRLQQMSALTELSEADELKAAVAATGEPRLIALLERLDAIVMLGSLQMLSGNSCTQRYTEARAL